MIYDIFFYNGEKDILDIHLNVLDKYVDKFIIIEAKTTFSGNKKPLYFGKHETLFKPFWNKISYRIIDEDYSADEIALAENSPNTVGARHWKNEFLQKESIKKFLEGLKDNDMVYIGDVDEIWDLEDITYPAKLKLKVYAYWLNNRSNEQFWGTLVAKYKDIKYECLNHLRQQAPKTQKDCGWHFTSMGGLEEVKRKLNDSYTTESYNTTEVQRLLPQRLRERQDYLGRDFQFTKSEKDWPAYLKENSQYYQHLLR